MIGHNFPAGTLEPTDDGVERKTIREWGRETGWVVLDPDGFDRLDEHLWERLFTREEFDAGSVGSTVCPAPDHHRPRNE